MKTEKQIVFANDINLGIHTEEFIETSDKVGYLNYEPTLYCMLNELFTKYPPCDSTCFVDIGCGLGRTLFTAAYYGCPKIYGVEINKYIFDKLSNNLSCFIVKNGSQSQIKLLNIDVRNFSITSDMSHFYFFNPFYLKYFIYTINKITESYKLLNRNVYIYLHMPNETYTRYMRSNNIFRLIDCVNALNNENNITVYTDIYKIG